MMEIYISGDEDALMRIKRLADQIRFHIGACGMP